MEIDDIVRSHYGGTDLEATILHALDAAGVDLDALTAHDLAPVDSLHAGGPAATAYLFEQIALDASHRLLDVGCGLGGACRMAATTTGASVLGIDLSPDFVATARALTARVGLSSLVDHTVSSGDSIEAGDEDFDRAIMIHVGMNIEDKQAVFTEVRRVLRPGGLFGVFEQMRVGPGDLRFPMPWAEDERSSFVRTEQEYAEALVTAGFVVERTEDRSSAGGAPPRGAPLSPAVAFGPGFVENMANNVAATRAGTLGAVLVLARAD